MALSKIFQQYHGIQYILLRTSKFPQKKLNYASNYYGQNGIKKFYLILLIISGTEFIFSGDRH